MSHTLYLNGIPLTGHIKRICPRCGEELGIGRCPHCSVPAVKVDTIDYLKEMTIKEADERNKK